jgi:hypothetical protein
MKCKVSLKPAAAENVGRMETAHMLKNISGFNKVILKMTVFQII